VSCQHLLWYIYNTHIKFLFVELIQKSGAPGVNRTPDLGLQNRCFTTRTNGANLERVARIELANKPWQGFRLPLHHTRKRVIIYAPQLFVKHYLVRLAGIEPARPFRNLRILSPMRLPISPQSHRPSS